MTQTQYFRLLNLLRAEAARRHRQAHYLILEKFHAERLADISDEEAEAYIQELEANQGKSDDVP